MLFKFVESSTIVSVGYHNKVLTLYFKSGKVYNYFNVPKKHYFGLVEAKSVGSYFSKNIRDEFDSEILKVEVAV